MEGSFSAELIFKIQFLQMLKRSFQQKLSNVIKTVQISSSVTVLFHFRFCQMLPDIVFFHNLVRNSFRNSTNVNIGAEKRQL